MIVAVRLLLIAFLAFLALMLCGCFVGPLKPEVHRLDAAESDDARLDRVILTKRVVLERGKRKGGFYSGEKTVDVTATSAFGLEHETRLLSGPARVITGQDTSFTESG